MALTTVARGRVLAQWMRENQTQLGELTRADLLAMINALDDYLDANVANINQAIPQPARGTLSPAIKYEILGYILMRRAGRLRAEEDNGG